jgi:hypothetical protein
MRPTTIAGLAKLVELVKKYAQAIYAPTAAGASELRPVFAKAKITRTSPAVATTSDSPCAKVARWFIEIETADREYIRFAKTAPLAHPATWAVR